MRWADFMDACPELAALGEERFRRHEVMLLGTLRKNGWPRISPVEMDFVGGELMVGMMWQSPKALDLLRDPRYVAHSVVTNRSGEEGDFKLYGTARDIQDADTRARYRAAIQARIDWAPMEPSFHLFALDVDAAGFVVFGTNAIGMAWDAERGLRRWSQRDA
jgi:Pyridoxamine 5'-phosphate oxidase